jgi:hypothetical protein
MMEWLTLLIMVVGLWAQPARECGFALMVVQNGLDAFAAGEPQIGPYTDPDSYLLGGLNYIESYCGLRVDPQVFGR